MRYKIIIDSCGELLDEWKKDECFESIPLTLMVGAEQIIDECYAKAKSIIHEYDHVLHACAELLLEKEKISREEFEALFGDEA